MRRTSTIMVAATALIACGNGDASQSTVDAADPPADDASTGFDGGDDNTGSTTHKSGTRLRAQLYRTPDGAEQFTSIWHDGELNIRCSLALASDGKMRCLPSDALVVASIYFADAACTEALAYHPTCLADVPDYIRFAATSTCASAYRIHARGALFAGDIYQGNTENCFPATGARDFYDFYQIEAEVAPETYQEASIVVE